MSDFDEWFQRATGNQRFPYQRRFAEAKELPQLVDVPTGCGKTAMAILGWLWRRAVAQLKLLRRQHDRRDDAGFHGSPRNRVRCIPSLLEDPFVARRWIHLRCRKALSA